MGKQLKFLFLATLATLMVLAGSILQVGEPLLAATHTGGIADQLYTQYPDIPRAEDQSSNTLLSRFIDYHIEAKARPTQYHLDWELSMADYLDASYDHKQSSVGASGSSRVSGPVGVSSVDKQAMQTLSPQQRNQLISSLEQLFTQ